MHHFTFFPRYGGQGHLKHWTVLYALSFIEANLSNSWMHLVNESQANPSTLCIKFAKYEVYSRIIYIKYEIVNPIPTV